ncbi:MAG TPA: LuxR C-terminal-related transcriptional regulator [Streptosporangiaceae bacterium]|nr:LuxR C-terminal-related transcriptional regulator [Streptosporangiaceae bacterium]
MRCSACSRGACRTRQIAERLVIARKTVDNHVEHIYTKIAASNRDRAGLFAVRHGLMSPFEDR